MDKKTVILGASDNPERYSYKATLSLKHHGHTAVPVGIKKGQIGGETILNGTPPLQGVDTVTLYLNPENQKHYYEYIFSLNPKRIIFNPGTENPELMHKAKEKNIETEVACTLVLLASHQY